MIRQKVKKLQLLQFFHKKMVEAWQLEREFGFSHDYAQQVFHRLKKQGLIINMRPGRYELTEKGLRRLKYYGKRESKD